jgi:ribosomal RNA-processing protein 36
MCGRALVCRTGLAQGKTPFYLSKSAKKDLVLQEQFKALEAKGPGALDKFLEKKRKKNASKDRSKLPWKRPMVGTEGDE